MVSYLSEALGQNLQGVTDNKPGDRIFPGISCVAKYVMIYTKMGENNHR